MQLNLSIDIQTASADTRQADLFLFIDAQSLSYLVLDGANCCTVAVYDFDEKTTPESIANTIHQVVADRPALAENFRNIHVIYGFTGSTPVPRPFADQSNAGAFLDLMYGEARESVTRTAATKSGETCILYRVPEVIDMVVSRYFPSAQFTHLFAMAGSVMERGEAEIFAVFARGRLHVTVSKAGMLQLMQDYSFQGPADVSYHLLNACSSFGISVDEARLRMTGMIDKDSTLYTELYRYFPRLIFEERPGGFNYPESLDEYPAHYFSHLFCFATCV